MPLRRPTFSVSKKPRRRSFIGAFYSSRGKRQCVDFHQTADPRTHLESALQPTAGAFLDLACATLRYPRVLLRCIDQCLRRIDAAAETARRRIVTLEREIASLTAQEAEDSALLRQMAANLDLFTAQYKSGRRTLIELVGQFESYTRMQRDHATLKYRITLARLEIARERGVLVDGAAM